MITDLRVGDYIEKSELDTEQKYNDVVGVFRGYRFERGDGVTENYRYLNDYDCLVICKDGLWQSSSDRYKKRKLTYSDIMSLKKVDVDNCNIDKVADLGEVKTIEPCAGGISVGYESFEKQKHDGDEKENNIDWNKAPGWAEFYIGQNESGITGFGYLRGENLDSGGKVCAVIGSDFMLNFDALLDGNCIHYKPKSNDENTGPFAEPETTEKINIKEMLKTAKAVLAMESLGHEWDEEKGQWFRKEYF